MANQIYYQNLPIPSNMDSIPTYLNNELQILGNTISELDLKIGSGTGTNVSEEDILSLQQDIIQLEQSDVTLNLTVNTLSSKTNDSLSVIDSRLDGIDESLRVNSLQSANIISQITNISSDNIISKSEKSQIFRDWKQIFSEYNILIGKARDNNVDASEYIFVFNALLLYLTSDPIYIPNNPVLDNGASWCSDSINIYIDGNVFRQKFVSYYSQKESLEKLINEKINSDISVVSSQVVEVGLTAEQAAVDAAQALSLINSISSDSIISSNEKTSLFIEWKSIYDAKSGIVTQGTNAGVATTAYNTAYTTLYTMMTSAPISIQNPPTDGNAWCSDTNSIAIDSSTFRANFAAYYNERQNLLNAVSTSYNLKFTEIASDNKITQGEKSSLYMEWKTIYEEKPGITTQGTNASVSTTNYTNAYNTLVTYLTSTPLSMPANPTTDNGNTWCTDVTTITVVGTTFRANFASYYSERQLLLNAVATSIKSTADTASTNAAAAQSAANTASTNATSALNGITDILSDGKITQDEKPTIFMDWKAIYDEKPDIVTKATSYSVSTTNYTNAYNTLATYLTSAPISIDAAPTTGATWCASSTVIAITGTTFRGNFSTYYNERQLVLNAIYAAAKVLADNAQSTADTANSTAASAASAAATAQSTANTANSNANTALTQANTAITGLSDKLSKTANTVLSGSGAVIAGTLVINSSGARTSGSGVALTSAGLAGFNSSGTATFAIDTAGNASFAGALSAASGTFAGTLSSVGGSFTGSLTAATGTFAGSLSAVTGSFGAVALSTTGVGGTLSSGMTGFAAGTGWWMDYNSGTPRFSIGTGSAGTISNGLSWNGSTLVIKGNLTGSTGTFSGSLSVGSSPAVSGSTMTGTGAIFNSGGTFAIGSSTTNISFDNTTMTLNGNVVANGNIQTDAISTIKVSANSITNLLTSYWNTGLNPVPSPYTSWNLFHSYSFTCPTVGDGTTTLTGLFQVVVNTWNKNTTAGNVSRIQIGIGLSKDSTPTTAVRGSSSSMYMVAADGVDPIADYYGLDYPPTTDAYVSEIWTSTLTQGTAYTVRLFYYVSSTSGPRAVLDHASINITFLKR